jgi:peptidoglycan DL-endopeptidase LytF
LNLSKRFRNTVGAAALSLLILFSGLAGNVRTGYAATPITVGGKALIVHTDGATIRVREGAGTKYDQRAEAYEGQVVNVLAGPEKDVKGNKWYKIQGPNGTGWILADFLTGKSSTSDESSKVGSVGVITNTGGDNVRVREGAGLSYSRVAKVAEGNKVTILAGPSKDDNGNIWYKVETANGTGWVHSDFVAIGGPASKEALPENKSANLIPQAPKITGYGKVANTSGDYLRVRSKANTKGSVITTISPGTTVAIKEGPLLDAQNIAWYHVSAGGVTGWVMGKYLAQGQAPAQAAKEQEQPSIEAREGTARGAEQPVAVREASSSVGASIVSNAMKYLGSRYVYGGMSPRGFDCSGFVAYVAGKSGRKLAHSIPSQINSGVRISSKELQPGDLVFFSNTYKRGLSHAAIYIGNGKIIHAANESTGVTISSLWSPYWAAHYTTAVRLK